MIDTKKKQTMRYSDEELGFIKSVFSENESYVDALKYFFFQGEMTPAQKSVLTVNTNKDVIAILRKALLPTIDCSAPFFQMVDMFTNINTQEQPVEGVYNQAVIKEVASDYLDSMFKILEGSKKKPTIEFAYLAKIKDKTPADVYTDLGTRNFLVQHIQMNLQTLVLLAGRKDQSVDETVKELQNKAKDSSK